MNRRKICRNSILAAAVLFVTGGIGGSWAYFTDSETKVNIFTMGDLELGLSEPEWDPESEDGVPDGVNMYPGYTVYKNPTIRNITSDKNGETPCYARVRMDITDREGNLVTDKDVIAMIEQMIYFDKTYDGTYTSKGEARELVEGRIPGYCLEELETYPMINPVFVKDEERSTPGSAVYNYLGEKGDGILYINDEAALFTNVIVPTDWNQKQLQMVGDFHLEIRAECIQYSGFESQEAAYKALDEEIIEESISG